MIIYDKDKKVLFLPENDDVEILEWNDIYHKGFRDGYREGYDKAYEDNYQSGYTDGYAEGIVACHVDATSIHLDIPSVIVGSGKADVIVEPADADVELIFTSSDEDIATIDENGHITVKEDGEVTFCVRDKNSGLQNCQTVSVEEPSREIYVQTLIDEGYATVITGQGGTYISILPTTPYSASQVLDLGEVTRNEKQLTGTTNNIIVWNQELPNGWTNSDITSLYTNKQLNFSPRGEMLWVLGDVDNFEITFSGGGWIASDYPWGSYKSEGVFAPRWNASKQAEYISKGFLKTPKNLTVNLTSSFSSVSQVMFTQAKSTTALTINQQAGTFACHDVTGMFEGDSALVTLNITGAFNYGTWRTMHNTFDGCTALTGIPYSTSWSREHTNNSIYPHADGARGSANAYHMFRGLNSLTYLGPTINMGAMSLSGCTYDGQNQAALTDTFFDCPELTDVRIINLNNNDWNFADSSTFTYIPKMSAASIEYLLNNAADVTSQGGHSVTFASTYKDSVSASAIAYAQNKGWNVIWAE